MSDPSAPRPRLLVVEDDDRLRELLREGLESEGFCVDGVRDGDAALAMPERHDYAAIVLDVRIPGRSGYQVCAELRARRNRTPVLMLSAKDGEYDEADGLDTGADDYVTKPFSFVVLVSRLRALMRRDRQEHIGVIVLGDLRIEPESRSCARGADRVTLTAKEFDLLHHLARRAGRVVSKADLMDALWDRPADGLEAVNLVEVHVRHLRQKIDLPYGCRSIRTVRGAGYVLDLDGGRGRPTSPPRPRYDIG
ncbi:response regulator transcription factor [Streptomyces sp. NPDC059009]|uniref:response regulator transcription factor n=1 Tax=Streptomyces sp. NPDC059009 TaxID=3346694 RepID=UPI0036908B60